MPYWGLYLQALGFDAVAIGELTAFIMFTRIIAPNLWSWVAAQTQRPMLLVRLGSFLAICCFLGVFVGQQYYWLAFVMSAFSFFWNAVLPQFEAVTLAYLGHQAHYYSRVRVWGSIGFIITVGLFGWLFEYINILLLPLLLTALFSAIWLTSLLVPEQPITQPSRAQDSFYQVLWQPTVLALFAVCFLMQASHGPYYTFYSIYLEEQGYTRDTIGQLWALGVIAEVGIFLIMHRLLARFPLKFLLLISFLLTGLRWLLIGYGVHWLTILLLAQLLHAASFGMYHGVVMHLIRQYFTDHHQGRAQALYSSLSFGAGSAVGSLFSGYTWATAGAQISYVIASLLCGIAIGISWYGIKYPFHLTHGVDA